MDREQTGQTGSRASPNAMISPPLVLPRPPPLAEMGSGLAVRTRSARQRLPVDLDEDERGRPCGVTHPDGGRDGSRPRVHALPDTARRVAVPPAGRRLTLALLEALL